MENQVEIVESKAYSLNELIESLKGRGLDVAEDMAEVLVSSVFDWIETSAIKSENKYDDLLLAAMPLVKSQILAQIDKIDGNVESN